MRLRVRAGIGSSTDLPLIDDAVVEVEFADGSIVTFEADENREAVYVRTGGPPGEAMRALHVEGVAANALYLAPKDPFVRWAS